MSLSHPEDKQVNINYECPTCKIILKVPENAVQVFCLKCKQRYVIKKKGSA